MARKVLITSALPYANGPLHLGHLAGAYLPADIYTRFKRLQKKEEVIHICGTDEHGAAITIRAEREGIPPKALVDRYHAIIRQDFEDFGIAFDHFSRTSQPIHHETSQDFFLKLYHQDDIVPRTVTQLYCPEDQLFLPDRYVEGVCPYCGYEQARGDQCEQCGRWLEPFQLQQPRCVICGTRPEPRETTHYYFRLSAYAEPLRRWLEGKRQWRASVRNTALGWIQEGLKDRPITRDLSWGVPVPLPEAKGKVLYVWFDAPIGYVSATREWGLERFGDPDHWKSWWLDTDTRLVHFIGKDNIVFHAIVWPAMLMAHGDYVLPAEIPANQFLVFRGGEKFSTSRGTAIWLRDALEQFPADFWRYALAANLPETKDAEFDLEELRRRVNHELADTLGNFVQRSLGFLHRFREGRVPPPTEWKAEEVEVLNRLQSLSERIEHALEEFRFRDALHTVMEAAREGNRYLDRKEPWRTRKTDPVETDRTLYTAVQVLRTVSIWMHPFLPHTTGEILDWLGLKADQLPPYRDAAIPDPSLGGRTLRPIRILYPKIEAPVDAGSTENVKASKPSAPEEPSMEHKPQIKIDEFARLEIRVGTIVEAAPHPNADRLLVLKVDIGGEIRQLVAGIANRYRPEDLPGKQIPVLVNLKPARLRGVESQGMILAATDPEGGAVLLHPDRDVPPGSEVR